MNTRETINELAARHGLGADPLRALLRLAGLDAQPEGLARRLPRSVALLGAALAGLGLLMWVAANWAELGRMMRFALLQALLLAACLGAAARPAARAPLALLAFLATGALFAYFGQTYQTGADAWQLFALWALLGLPLALGTRSDLLWAPWALVAMLAIVLWTHTHSGYLWRVTPDELRVHLIGFAAILACGIALSPALQRLTGAGAWALRCQVLLAVVAISAAGLAGLFHSRVAPQYGLALLVLGAAAVLLSSRRGFEVFALSAVALALNSLLVGGLVRLLFHERRSGDPIGELLLLGLCAAGLLAASVSLILRLQRRSVEGRP